MKGKDRRRRAKGAHSKHHTTNTRSCQRPTHRWTRRLEMAPQRSAFLPSRHWRLSFSSAPRNPSPVCPLCPARRANPQHRSALHRVCSPAHVCRRPMSPASHRAQRRTHREGPRELPRTFTWDACPGPPADNVSALWLGGAGGGGRTRMTPGMKRLWATAPPGLHCFGQGPATNDAGRWFNEFGELCRGGWSVA